MKPKRVLAFGVAVTVALTAVFVVMAGGRVAARPDVSLNFGKITVLADSSPGMAEELDVLARVWEEAQVPGGPYLGWRFADRVNGPFVTTEAATFGNWLRSLDTTADDSCPDNVLEALWAATRPGRAQEPGQATALLLTDSTPRGDRARLVALGNRLVRADIQLYQVISDWCEGAPFRARELAFLSQVTGGFAQAPGLDGEPLAGERLSETMRVVAGQAMAAGAVMRGSGIVHEGVPDSLTFPVDPRLDGFTVLGVDSDPEEYDPCLYILTWTMPLREHPRPSFSLHSPGGQVITPGTPGIEAIQVDNMTQFLIPVDGPEDVGEWQLRVNGAGHYYSFVDGHTQLHADYLGPHILPAGRAVSLSVALATEDAGGTPFNFQQVQLGLFDGMGRWLGPLGAPGQPGSCPNGGSGCVTASHSFSRGVYYIGVRGRLAGGAPFQRIDPAPIRVTRFSVRDAAPATAKAGQTVTHAFAISNEGDVSETLGLEVSSDLGWAVTGTVPVSINLEPGTGMTVAVRVRIPDDAAPGAVDTVLLTAFSGESIYISASGAALTEVGGARLYLPVTIRPGSPGD